MGYRSGSLCRFKIAVKVVQVISQGIQAVVFHRAVRPACVAEGRGGLHQVAFAVDKKQESLSQGRLPAVGRVGNARQVIIARADDPHIGAACVKQTLLKRLDGQVEDAGGVRRVGRVRSLHHEGVAARFLRRAVDQPILVHGEPLGKAVGRIVARLEGKGDGIGAAGLDSGGIVYALNGIGQIFAGCKLRRHIGKAGQGE